MPNSIPHRGVHVQHGIPSTVREAVTITLPAGDTDELEDERELRDPEVRRIIGKSHEDYLAGRTRPAEELFTELDEERKVGDQKEDR